MESDHILGWDLGGAHLKAALLNESGKMLEAVQLPCPLWKGIDQLERCLLQVQERFGISGHHSSHAVTMTGELVDLFPDRLNGVVRILDAFNDCLKGNRLKIYAGADGFLSLEEAVANPGVVASANWHATARLAALVQHEGLLVDIGSTTADIVPFANGIPKPRGHADHERLVHGELVYSGVVRTPVMALTRTVPFRGNQVPLMAEHFATSADIYRLLGELPDEADQHPAADGGEKTREGSARRLARMLGLDFQQATMEEWEQVAAFLARQHFTRFMEGCALVLSGSSLPASAPIVGAGTGRFLVEKLAMELGRSYLDFEKLVQQSSDVAQGAADCAPAVAVARLLAVELS